MLEITDLSLGYKKNHIVTIPSLQLHEAGQMLVCGPSGCGKTTLLYTIAGLTDALSGHISVAGTDIMKLTESQRDRFRAKRIGIIFQALHLIPSLTVMQNLLLATCVAGLSDKRERAEALLHRLGIYDKKNALPSRISQGQAQRVAIARAVLHEPPLILADEPTSSLDDHACATVIELIRQVASDSGAALLISTHDSRVKAHFPNAITLGGVQ